MATKEKVAQKAIEKAAESIDALAERAKDALYSLAHQAEDFDPGELRDNAWRMAGRAGAQASDFAGDLYTRGQKTALAVRGQVEEQPWIAIAAVGIVALMLGYAMRRSR